MDVNLEDAGASVLVDLRMLIVSPVSAEIGSRSRSARNACRRTVVVPLSSESGQADRDGRAPAHECCQEELSPMRPSLRPIP